MNGLAVTLKCLQRGMNNVRKLGPLLGHNLGMRSRCGSDDIVFVARDTSFVEATKEVAKALVDDTHVHPAQSKSAC